MKTSQPEFLPGHPAKRVADAGFLFRLKKSPLRLPSTRIAEQTFPPLRCHREEAGDSSVRWRARIGQPVELVEKFLDSYPLLAGVSTMPFLLAIALYLD